MRSILLCVQVMTLDSTFAELIITLKFFHIHMHTHIRVLSCGYQCAVHSIRQESIQALLIGRIRFIVFDSFQVDTHFDTKLRDTN